MTPWIAVLAYHLKQWNTNAIPAMVSKPCFWSQRIFCSDEVSFSAVPDLLWKILCSRFRADNASPDPRSLRKLITQQRDWVIIAENVLRALSKPKVDFPKSGYGVRGISITPGSRDFESLESRVANGRERSAEDSRRLPESGRDGESSRGEKLAKQTRTQATSKNARTGTARTQGQALRCCSAMPFASNRTKLESQAQNCCSDITVLLR